MKNFKKALCLLLTCAMVLTLVACGGGDKKEEGGAEASGDATWKIGGIGPITGGAAMYGLGVKNAIQIAVDEVNEAGGIAGAQIEYQFEDDEHDPEKSVNAYNTLKDWGMQLLIGTVTSGPGVAVGAEASNDNMFMLTPSGSSVDVVNSGDNVFQICFTDPNQGIASAQYIGTKGIASKVAVIYDSSDVYSSGIYAKFKEEAANQPFDIVAEGAFTADNKTDFSVPLQQAKDNGAELIFLPIYYTEASLILTQAASMGVEATFFGCDGLDGILGVENFDTSLAEGVLLLTPFAADAEDEATQKFVEKYQADYKEIPNQFAADAYDAVYAIKAAIEKAGATPDMDAAALGDAMKAAMTEINVVGLTSDEAGMTWAETGEVSKAPKAVVIKDGAYVTAE